MESPYPELQNLQQFVDAYHVVARRNNMPIEKYLTAMTLFIADEQFDIQVDDEYCDLDLEHPLVHIVLTLRALELIEESTDYLQWCNFLGISTGNEQLRRYYQRTVKLLPNIRAYFNKGEVTSFITDMDFELNAGAMQYLREQKEEG